MAETCDWCHRPCGGDHWTALSGECGAHLPQPASRRAVAAEDCAAARYRWLTAEVARLSRIESRLAQYRDGLPERGEVLVVRAVLTTILEGRP